MSSKNILEELEKIQKRYGYLKRAELIRLSKETGVPISRICSSASFYSFLNKEKKGQHTIRVCNNLPCIVNGSDKILSCLGKILKIKPGESTRDGKFCLETTSCIGCCNKPPAMMIDSCIFTELDEKKVRKIIKRFS